MLLQKYLSCLKISQSPVRWHKSIASLLLYDFHHLSHTWGNTWKDIFGSFSFFHFHFHWHFHSFILRNWHLRTSFWLLRDQFFMATLFGRAHAWNWMSWREQLRGLNAFGEIKVKHSLSGVDRGDLGKWMGSSGFARWNQFTARVWQCAWELYWRHSLPYSSWVPEVFMVGKEPQLTVVTWLIVPHQ